MTRSQCQALASAFLALALVVPVGAGQQDAPSPKPGEVQQPKGTWQVPGEIHKGFGETRPIAPNTGAGGADDPLARQRNRRVEIVADTCGRG